MKVNATNVHVVQEEVGSPSRSLLAPQDLVVVAVPFEGCSSDEVGKKDVMRLNVEFFFTFLLLFLSCRLIG